MKYNFNTHQLELDNKDLLDLLKNKLNANELKISECGYHYEWDPSGGGYSLSNVVSENKASDSDIAVYKALQTIEKELGLNKP